MSGFKRDIMWMTFILVFGVVVAWTEASNETDIRGKIGKPNLANDSRVIDASNDTISEENESNTRISEEYGSSQSSEANRSTAEAVNGTLTRTVPSNQTSSAKDNATPIKPNTTANPGGKVDKYATPNSTSVQNEEDEIERKVIKKKVAANKDKDKFDWRQSQNYRNNGSEDDLSSPLKDTFSAIDAEGPIRMEENDQDTNYQSLDNVTIRDIKISPLINDTGNDLQDIDHLNDSISKNEFNTNMEQNITNIPTNMEQNMTNIPTIMGENMTSIPTNMEQNMTNIPTIMGENMTSIPTNMEQNMTNIPTIMGENMTSIPTNMEQNMTNIPTNMGENMTSIPTNMGENITSIPTNMGENITSIPTIMGENITSIPTNMEQNMTSIPTNMGENMTSIPTNMEQNMTNIPTNMGENMTSIPTNMGENITSIPTIMGENTTSIPTNMEQNMTSIPTNMGENMTSIPTNMGENMTSIPTNLGETKSSIPTEITSSIPTNLEENTSSIPTNLEENTSSIPTNMEENTSNIPTENTSNIATNPEENTSNIATNTEENTSSKPRNLELNTSLIAMNVEENKSEKPAENTSKISPMDTLMNDQPIQEEKWRETSSKTPGESAKPKETSEKKNCKKAKSGTTDKTETSTDSETEPSTIKDTDNSKYLSRDFNPSPTTEDNGESSTTETPADTTIPWDHFGMPFGYGPWMDGTFGNPLWSEEDPFTRGPDSRGKQIKINGEISIIKGQEWKTELGQSDTIAFGVLAAKVKQQLKQLYAKTSISKVLNRIEITGFKPNEGVVVTYNLLLQTSSDLISRHYLVKIFNKNLKDGSNLGPYSLDPEATTFDLERDKSLHLSDSGSEDPSIPQWAIAFIVVAAACLIFSLMFAAVTVYGRSQGTRTNGTLYDREGMVESCPGWERKLAAAYENIAADSVYDNEDGGRSPPGRKDSQRRDSERDVRNLGCPEERYQVSDRVI